MDTTIGSQRPTWSSKARRNKGKNAMPRKGKYVSPQDVARIARKALQGGAEVKETSYIYNSVGGAIGAIAAQSLASISYGAGAVAACLCQGIGAGTTYNARVGNEISLKNIEISLALTAGDQYNFLRFLVVRPKGQFANANPSIIAFVQSLFSGNGSSTFQFGCPVDNHNFEVWADDLIPMQQRVGAASSGSSSDTFVPYVYNKKVSVNRKVKFQESLSICDRDFWLVAISDSTAVPHPGAVAGYVKLRWTDV